MSDAAAYPGPVSQPPHYEDSSVRVDKLIVGPFENNVFVVRCKRTGDAVLIDAANEHELLVEVCRRSGVRRVLTTHGHWDHIQAVTAVRDAGIDVGIAARDAEMLPSYDFVIPDDEVYPVGDLRLRSVHTPGHTLGSTSFRLEDSPLLFTGDTLFPGGPGNTNRNPEAFARVMRSVDDLFAFGDDVAVSPGHGLDTTLGRERPYVEVWRRRGW